jgi:hypothetical protein
MMGGDKDERHDGRTLVVVPKLMENSTTHGSRSQASTTLDKLAREKTADRTPHASKIAFYIFFGSSSCNGRRATCMFLFFC